MTHCCSVNGNEWSHARRIVDCVREMIIPERTKSGNTRWLPDRVWYWFNELRLGQRIHIRAFRKIKREEMIFWMIYSRTAAVANAERWTKVNFIGGMFMIGKWKFHSTLFLIETNILIIAWITRHKGNVDRQQYVQKLFHAANLYGKVMQYRCKKLFSQKYEENPAWKPPVFDAGLPKMSVNQLYL